MGVKRKPPSDPNQAAKSILDRLTGDEPEMEPAVKNPAAVELGRRGGKARAAALSAEEQQRIGQEAARKRWGDKKP